MVHQRRHVRPHVAEQGHPHLGRQRLARVPGHARAGPPGGGRPGARVRLPVAPLWRGVQGHARRLHVRAGGAAGGREGPWGHSRLPVACHRNDAPPPPTHTHLSFTHHSPHAPASAVARAWTSWPRWSTSCAPTRTTGASCSRRGTPRRSKRWRCRRATCSRSSTSPTASSRARCTSAPRTWGWACPSTSRPTRCSRGCWRRWSACR